MARPASHFENFNRIHVKRQWCKGCGICTTLCDKKVLLLDNRGKAIVANPSACTGCEKCATHCPDLAITVDHYTLDKGMSRYAWEAGQSGGCSGLRRSCTDIINRDRKFKKIEGAHQ